LKEKAFFPDINAQHKSEDITVISMKERKIKTKIKKKANEY